MFCFFLVATHFFLSKIRETFLRKNISVKNRNVELLTEGCEVRVCNFEDFERVRRKSECIETFIVCRVRRSSTHLCASSISRIATACVITGHLAARAARTNECGAQTQPKVQERISVKKRLYDKSPNDFMAPVLRAPTNIRTIFCKNSSDRIAFIVGYPVISGQYS